MPHTISEELWQVSGGKRTQYPIAYDSDGAGGAIVLMGGNSWTSYPPVGWVRLADAAAGIDAWDPSTGGPDPTPPDAP